MRTETIAARGHARIAPLSLLVLLSAASLGGCAAPVADAEPEADLCLEAERHVQSCMGSEADDVLVASSCDPEAARAVLDQSCATLAGAGKADWLGAFLCRLGLLRYCPVPACDADGALALGAGGSCGELIELETCGQCDYYLCRDAASAHECGEEGYYQGYGYEYCNRFLQVTEPRLSAAGREWSARVRPCLMRALEADAGDDLSCRDLKQLAFDSHPRCYVEAGFCSLPISDWVLVLNTVDKQDVDLRQILTTGVSCLAGAFEPGGLLDR